MNQAHISDIPSKYSDLLKESDLIGFTMPSDLYIGTLLKILIASKPKGRFLELGTGIGLSLSWMVDGMDNESSLITIDNDPDLIAIVNRYFKKEKRVKIICEDAYKWIGGYQGKKFDLIFADAWPGKYCKIDEILSIIKVGGFYVIDDMTPQPNWPDNHGDNVDKLITYIEERKDFSLTKMNWSTGLIIAVRIK